MRILIGLAVLVTLALLASSRRWWAMRRHPVGAMLTTGGWLAVGIGVMLGPGAIGLIDAPHVDVLRPLVLFCLGWVGLMLGMQLRYDLPKLLPTGVARLAAGDFLASMIVLPAAAVTVMVLLSPVPDPMAVIVLAGILGTCGVSWAAEVRSLAGEGNRLNQVIHVLRAASGLGAVLAVLVYGLIFMFVRHQGASLWSLGPVTLGLGMMILVAAVFGVLGYQLVRLAGRGDSQFLVVLLGLVAFTAGASATMGFSPLLVGMLCGVVTVNMPGATLANFKRVIIDAEQPIAMALLLTAGVLADPHLNVTVLALVGVLAAGRLVVKLVLDAPLMPVVVMDRGVSPLKVAPLRQTPLAIALAMGYAVSGHESATASMLTGGQLLMVVILVGFIVDTVPLLTRLIRRGAEPRNGQAGPSDDVQSTTEPEAIA